MCQKCSTQVSPQTRGEIIPSSSHARGGHGDPSGRSSGRAVLSGSCRVAVMLLGDGPHRRPPPSAGRRGVQRAIPGGARAGLRGLCYCLAVPGHEVRG